MINNKYILETALEQIEAEISTDIAKIKILTDDPSATTGDQDAIYEIHEILHHLGNHISAREAAKNLLKIENNDEL